MVVGWRAFVSDGRMVSSLIRVVLDDHSTTIGQVDEVLPLGPVTISLLRVTEVGAVVVVGDAVPEVILSWVVVIYRFWFVNWFVSRLRFVYRFWFINWLVCRFGLVNWFVSWGRRINWLVSWLRFVNRLWGVSWRISRLWLVHRLVSWLRLVCRFVCGFVAIGRSVGSMNRSIGRSRLVGWSRGVARWCVCGRIVGLVSGFVALGVSGGVMRCVCGVMV